MPERPARGASLERPAARRPRSPAGGGGRRWDAVTVAWFAAIVALAAVVCVFYSLHMFADSFYDLYAGRYTVPHGIPHTAVVPAASRGAPGVDPQWLASVACTPYGAGVLHYYRQINAVTPALARYVTEWQRPNPLYLVSMAFFAVAMATAIAVAVAWRRGARPEPLLAVIAVALLGLAL